MNNSRTLMVGCVLVSIACAPRQSFERQAEIALKAKCREDGGKFASEWKAAHPSATAVGGDPELTTFGGWLALDEQADFEKKKTQLFREGRS